MDRRKLMERLAALPAEAQDQVKRLVDSLAKRRRSRSKSGKPQAWAAEPFIGMWRDHGALADSNAWVRTMRGSEWAGRVQ